MTPKEAYEARRKPIRERNARLRAQWEKDNPPKPPRGSPHHTKKGPGRYHVYGSKNAN